MRAAAEHAWGSPTLAGRRVGVSGLGKVGKHLTGHLIDDGASVVATDVNPNALAWVRQAYPQVDVVADTQALITSDIDVYAPCALGGALDDDTVPALRASVVVGAANNQLAHPGIEKLLADRGVLYAPDYVVNAGGVIQVADEIEGFNFERAKLRATRIYDTTREILRLADAEGCRRRSPPTGSPSAGWPRSAGCAPSTCVEGSRRSRGGAERGTPAPRPDGTDLRRIAGQSGGKYAVLDRWVRRPQTRHGQDGQALLTE
ncbi:hypothetical protein GCM10027615_11340 [Plantactinospora veratri]